MAQTRQDYYELLGVSRTASADEIRKAYRKLAFQYHPDRNSEAGSAERFKQVKEAYEVLSDPQKRATYDRFGHAGLDGSFASGFPGFAGFGVEDLFDTFFGTGSSTRRRQSARQGADLRVDLILEFEEAVFGGEKEFTVQKYERCQHCSGRGIEPGKEPVTCTRCGGTGELRRAHQSVFGQFVNVNICDRCQGEGKIITDPCSGCGGHGRSKVSRTLRLSIPAGIEDGQQIRLSGEGEPGPRGGPAGNLHVVIHVKPHRFLRREGNDLWLELPINIAQAALGDEVEVPTLDGPVRVRIPAATQSGRVVKVRGKGVPYLREHGRGDLKVALNVTVPTELTAEQSELLTKLASTFGRAVAPRENKGFFEKVKDVFGV